MWWVDIVIFDEWRSKALGPFLTEQEAEWAGMMSTIDSSDYHVWEEKGDK